MKSNLIPKFISSYFIDKNIQKITTKPTQKCTQKHTQPTQEPTKTYRKLPFVAMEHVQKKFVLNVEAEVKLLLDVCYSC